ncbi:conserved Plasmodium protein, unknown function [Plasmodium berghei]|uniref:Cytochrome c oxidase subunit ApiCOX26, putative n=2 Tax=Plasmodium berghei TaxID=5821 RepID=A0A509AN33_PLABA|nr:cytochrome c oxidase subunit ApiCOX26, putative [Plasmodium berghei ANKA]CXI88103.1 conserved Plasmodium protein, unknown function [Plasmodium berghei]SCL95899.1 conserved Plasmodium protein, unknown function [Plasmodium berghei]SCM16310.1 conserved Plasmodium protein, unknown function [Plasmodium berghei]SCM18106.1 conserved Plasmodium protein, unknown function [Plasmodium berghei]SCN27533.1 conserved Plasmodium protein, unknown function [Plasmodium berghei]|eukprot:XP_034423188.1 cytochrome c oxidase subunit ApiCOX26, putative [Plasmodium berghei ANKA]
MFIFHNAQHYFNAFRNFNGCYTDNKLLKYFFKKSYNTWFNDPSQYNYYFISYYAVAISFGVVLRHILFNPDVHFRRQDKRRNIIDRYQHHAYSLPYYNHWLRNFSQSFKSSIIDNEPDYQEVDPLSFRPKRTSFYARFPFFFEIPKYNVDNPHYEKNSHTYMQEYYESIGYIPTPENTEE